MQDTEEHRGEQKLSCSPEVAWDGWQAIGFQPVPEQKVAMEVYEDVDDVDSTDLLLLLDKKFEHHVQLVERYAKLRKLQEASLAANGDNGLLTVDLCDAEEFEALNKHPFENRLQELYPFPVFDVVQFFDVDPNDPTHTHYYLVPNPARNGELEEARGSATGFIHSYFDEFEEAAHARRIALELMLGSRWRRDEYTRITEEMTHVKFPVLEAKSEKHLHLLETLKQHDEIVAAGNEIDRTQEIFVDYHFVLYEELYKKVVALWDWGSRSGTALHRAIELYLDNPRTIPTHNPVYLTLEFQYFLNFFRDVFMHGNNRIVRSELRVADWRDDRDGTYVEERARHPQCPEALRELLCATYCAGSVDLIYRDVTAPENELMIADWKRSKKIWEKASGDKCGRGPCAEVPDCNLYHYYLQLNLYAYLVEANTHYKVTKLTILVFHPNNDNYVPYDVPDYRVVIHNMLLDRIKHNYVKVYTSDSDEDRRKRDKMEQFIKRHESRKRKPRTILEMFNAAPHQRALDKEKSTQCVVIE